MSNLLVLLRRDINNGNNQTEEFKDRLHRALDMAPDNEELLGYLDSEIWNAEIDSGSLILYFGNAEKFTLPPDIKKILSFAFSTANNTTQYVFHDDIVFIADEIFPKDKAKLKIHCLSSDSTAAKYCTIKGIEYEVLNIETNSQSFRQAFDNLMFDIYQISKIKENGINTIKNHYKSISEKTKNIANEADLRTRRNNSVIGAVIFLAFAITQGTEYPFLLWFFIPGSLLIGLAIFFGHHLKICLNKKNIDRYIKLDTLIWEEKFSVYLESLFNEYGYSDFSMLWNSSEADLKSKNEFISKIQEILIESPITPKVTFEKIHSDMSYPSEVNTQFNKNNNYQTEEFLKLLDIV